MNGPKSAKSKSDVQHDPHVASSRADSENGGSYVGRTGPDDDFSSGDTGTDARTRAAED